MIAVILRQRIEITQRETDASAIVSLSHVIRRTCFDLDQWRPMRILLGPLLLTFINRPVHADG